MKEKHQKELKTNKETQITDEFGNASLETFGETKQRLSVETRLNSYLQSRRKVDLFIKHSHTCISKMKKN